MQTNLYIEAPPRQIVVLDSVSSIAIGEIVGTEPLTTDQFMRKLWNFLLKNNCIQVVPNEISD